MTYEIYFEWQGKPYQATVTEMQVNGIPTWRVNYRGKTKDFINDGSGWSCIPFDIPYELKNRIGHAINEQRKGKRKPGQE